MEPVNTVLRRLRASARPPISLREMGERLNISHGTYHNYERPNGFKGRFLPVDTARRIAAVLAERGVNPDEVMALAGVGVDERKPVGLSAFEERLLEGVRKIGPEQRHAVMVLVDSMVETFSRLQGGMPVQIGKETGERGLGEGWTS